MRLNEIKTQVESETYYVIGWEQQEITLSANRKTKQYRNIAVFYKSGRYTPYSGCLQVEYYASEAKKWKTLEGATKALAKIKADNVQGRTENAVVCRWTHTATTQQFLIVADGE